MEAKGITTLRKHIENQAGVQTLLNRVLSQIEAQAVKFLNEDETTIDGDFHFYIGNKNIGEVKYGVSLAVTSPSFSGDYDTAPHGYEGEYILDFATVDFDGAFEPLTPIINNLLKSKTGKTL